MPSFSKLYGLMHLITSSYVFHSTLLYLGLENSPDGLALVKFMNKVFMFIDL
jgi:hypothetical protein